MHLRLPILASAGIVLALLAASLSVENSWIATYLVQGAEPHWFAQIFPTFLTIGLVAAAMTAGMLARPPFGIAIAALIAGAYAGLILSPAVLGVALLFAASLLVTGEALARAALRESQPLHVVIALGGFAQLAVTALLSLPGLAGGLLHVAVLLVVAIGCAAASLGRLGMRLQAWSFVSFRSIPAAICLFAALLAMLWAVTSVRALGLCTDCAIGLYRPDIYLLGSGSIYSPSSLLWGTHFYPKGFEMLVAPFMFSTHGAELRLANILIGYAVLAGVMATFSRTYLDRDQVHAPLLAVAATLPVFLFAVSQAKADALEAVFMVAGVLHLGLAARARSIEQFAVSCLLMVFALTVRNHMYVFVLTMIPALLAVGTGLLADAGARQRMRAVAIVAASVTIFAAVVFLRNFAITGLIFPTPPIGPSTASAFRAAFSELTGLQTRGFASSFSDVFGILRDIFFAPASVGLHKDRWSGLSTPWNALFFVLLVLVPLLRRREILSDARFLVPAWAAASAWAALIYGLAFSINRRGGDGNYLIYPGLIAAAPVLFCAARLPGMLRAWSVGAAFLVVVNLAAVPFAAYAPFRLIESAFGEPGLRPLDRIWQDQVDAAMARRSLLDVAGLLRVGSGRLCRVTLFDKIPGVQARGELVPDLLALHRLDCVIGNASASALDVDLVLSDRSHTAIILPATADRFEASIRGRLEEMGGMRHSAGKFVVYTFPDRRGEP